MLLVIFHIGKERYALDSSHVLEIVPMVAFKKIPRAPEYLCGLFHYRGKIVPVIDVSCLSGEGVARRFLSTRVILAEVRDFRGHLRTVGLLAERVTDTLKVREGDLTQAVVKLKEAPYLGDVITDALGMILCIGVNELLSPEVQEMLFPNDPES